VHGYYLELASPATWGGIGAVIRYSLGTAFPLFI
jgi:hypothetical protein